MTSEHETRSGVQAWVQVHLGRPGYMVAFAGLCMGTLVYFAGSREAASGVLAVVFGLLVALPVVNVVAILIEEVRRRDWAFVVAAVVVIGLIAYGVFDRIN